MIWHGKAFGSSKEEWKLLLAQRWLALKGKKNHDTKTSNMSAVVVNWHT